MAALSAEAGRPVEFLGVGGPSMEAAGLKSLFPLSETALMGPIAIARRLPRLVRLVWRTVDEIVRFRPDVLVIVDSPEFTHAVARRVRRRLPELPVVDYVSPTVWAWRPWRAKSMRAYVDRVAAIFPFEPEVHRRLGGPPCTYVGHPAVERVLELEQGQAAGQGQGPETPVLLVLPGSRITEVERLMPVFGETVARLSKTGEPFRAVLPTVPHLEGEVRRLASGWPVAPEIVTGEAEKWVAFTSARAALAASGTVTLELALAGVPMVVGYRLDPLTASLKWMLRLHSVVMANLILGDNAFPEFIHHDCTPERLAEAVGPLLGDTPERAAQLAACARVREATMTNGEPSRLAARVVLEEIDRK